MNKIYMTLLKGNKRNTFVKKVPIKTELDNYTSYELIHELERRGHEPDVSDYLGVDKDEKTYDWERIPF